MVVVMLGMTVADAGMTRILPIVVVSSVMEAVSDSTGDVPVKVRLYSIWLAPAVAAAVMTEVGTVIVSGKLRVVGATVAIPDNGMETVPRTVPPRVV
ncbi:MAG TPA: hypothetical protein ENI80_01160 [Acidiferrobacteraceae bacterium]|nr:hypothetical protein [Acidiferrobacteraceae bacterium]